MVCPEYEFSNSVDSGFPPSHQFCVSHFPCRNPCRASSWLVKPEYHSNDKDCTREMCCSSSAIPFAAARGGYRANCDSFNLYFTPRVLLSRRFKSDLAENSCRLTRLYRCSSAGVVNDLALMLVCHRLPFVTALLPLTVILETFPQNRKRAFLIHTLQDSLMTPTIRKREHLVFIKLNVKFLFTSVAQFL